jgi:hypothetical protein
MNIYIYIINIPDPIAPRRSATMVIMPMQTPPQNAATGMYPSKYLTMDSSLKPLILTCSSFNFLATSLELSPEI